jgi:hypothetical protein
MMEARQSNKRKLSSSGVKEGTPAKKAKVSETESVEKVIQDFKKELSEEKQRIFDKLNKRMKKEQGLYDIIVGNEVEVFLQMQKKLERDRVEIEKQKKQVQALLELALEALASDEAPAPSKKKIKQKSAVATKALLGVSDEEDSESEEERAPAPKKRVPQKKEKIVEVVEEEEESEEEDTEPQVLPESALEQLNPERKSRLFFRNVNLKATDDSLRDYIKKKTARTPKTVWLCKHKTTGEFYGSCFVEMGTWQDAAQVLHLLNDKVAPSFLPVAIL